MAVWSTGPDHVHKSRRKAAKEEEEEINPRRKKRHFAWKAERGAYFCDWSCGDEPRFQCFFERSHGSMLERIRKRPHSVGEAK